MLLIHKIDVDGVDNTAVLHPENIDSKKKSNSMDEYHILGDSCILEDENDDSLDSADAN